MFSMSERLKFFLLHLFFSCCIALLVVGVVFLIWYPFPLAQAVGVTRIFLMLIAIDVIIGPLLGFIVYKKGKKSLKFDLLIIIFIQLGAFLYGLHTIAEGRPSWLVFSADRFELIRKNDIIISNIKNANPSYSQVSWLKPKLVGAEYAKDPEIRSNEIFTEMTGGVSIAQKPERYVDLSQVTNQMLQRSHKLDELNQYNSPALVKKALHNYPSAQSYLPMKATAVDMTVLIDKKGQVVKIVDLRPWN